MKRAISVGVLALAGGLVAAPAARAETIECTGVLTGFVDGNVVVPPFSTCLIVSAYVDGWVRVESASDLGFSLSTSKGDIRGESGLGISVHNSTVHGNIVMHDGVDFSLLNATVDGNVNIENYRGTDIRIGPDVGATTIRGNLQIKNSTQAANISIVGITIGQNLHFYDNSAPLEPIMFNRIGGNLHCEGNTPPPQHAGNVVGGHTQGQCEEGS